MDKNIEPKPHKDYLDLLPLFKAGYEEIGGYDFYQELFPDNETTFDVNDYGKPYKPNAIYLYHDERDSGSRRRLRRRIMLRDTWEEDYMDYVEDNPMTLCSGLAYRGRENTLANAQRLYAIIFDLDSVGLREWENIHFRWGNGVDPIPTYTALSGSGLHLYYVLDKPIDLYPNIKIQCKNLKHNLTDRVWDPRTTSKRNTRQYQSINQGFRMVGSINNKYGTPIRAFRTGERVSLEYLNSYVYEKNRVDLTKQFKPSKYDLDVAKEKFPEWYDRKVIHKLNMPKKWNIASKQGDALYQWWLSRAHEIEEGHRYFYMLCCVIYACKCDIPYEQLEKDMNKVFEILKERESKNPLTEYDMESALEAYDRELYVYPIDDIEKLCNIRIEKSRRNGRDQETHLEIARAIRDINQKIKGTDWRDGNGRPKGSGTKQEQIKEWRQANPEGTKAQCIRDTGISKPTVYKWWG